jgi:hypothetical protein
MFGHIYTSPSWVYASITFHARAEVERLLDRALAEGPSVQEAVTREMQELIASHDIDARMKTPTQAWTADNDPWLKSTKQTHTDNSKGMGKGKHATSWEALRLVPEEWLDAEGDAVEPIRAQDLEHGSLGIALLSMKGAEVWLRRSTPMSDGPLAVLLPKEFPDKALTEPRGVKVTFKVQDPEKSNLDARTGFLYNIGLIEVRRHYGTTSNWHSVAAPSCELILDVASSNFHGNHDAPLAVLRDQTKAALAKHWPFSPEIGRVRSLQFEDGSWGVQTTTRVSDEQADELLKLSGKYGLFVRRPFEAKENDTWVTFWFKGLRLEEMLQHSAATRGSAGLVRGRRSIGLRVERIHAEAAYHSLHQVVDPVLIDAIVGTSYLIKGCPLELQESALISYMREQKKWDVVPIGSRERFGLREFTVASKTTPAFNEADIKVNDVPFTLLVQGCEASTSSIPESQLPPVLTPRPKGKVARLLPAKGLAKDSKRAKGQDFRPGV